MSVDILESPLQNFGEGFWLSKKNGSPKWKFNDFGEPLFKEALQNEITLFLGLTLIKNILPPYS